MKGIELSRRFWHQVGEPILKARLGAGMSDISVALIGNGSEVLGLDDELSQDHNFWPRLTVLLQPGAGAVVGPDEMHGIVSQLPESFGGYPVPRSGLYPSIQFRALSEFICEHACVTQYPFTTHDWLTVNEQLLLELTSATVFHDPNGSLRDALTTIEFWPEPLVPFLNLRALQRLSEVSGIARSISRSDIVSTNSYFAQFSYFAIHLFHLLHRKYCPYPKWMAASVREIGPEGARLEEILATAVLSSELSAYRDCVLAAWAIIRSAFNANISPLTQSSTNSTDLHLLHLPGLEEMVATCTALVAPELASIPPYVQPPSYWGHLFDYTGFGVSFPELLSEHLNQMGPRTGHA